MEGNSDSENMDNFTKNSVEESQRTFNTRVDLRQAVEKELLSYMTAVQYDKVQGKLAFERKVTFTPFPNVGGSIEDPASRSHFLLIDYNGELQSILCGQYLNSDSSEG